ncbi:PASTA domain-containing protein [Bifidobacterium felsineum]|uniref:PASTA domain-containing protein n=1 Tax=Bifidobacterium felsineum TaxID=2045440 RepID=UPI001BDC32E3|nr:PASTA domain-containing protein [Bifidobacterium felsineum]
MLAALIIAGVALFVTYRMEVWGGKTLPDASSIAQETTDVSGKKKSAVKAKDVIKALEEKGLATKTAQVFSGEESGTFLGYQGAQAGERVKTGQTVVIRESAGPGVPKNTLGQQAQKVTQMLADMNVPVHYKKIYVSDTKKNPEGSVVATLPEAGQAVVKDAKDTGIYVGVATKADDNALPLDVMGKSVDEVKSQLESQGHSVTVKKHFSSKAYVGKVSGASPEPGSELSAGEDVVLYQGIDASQTKEAFTDTNTTGYSLENMADVPLAGSTSATDGRWCTNAGKCITISNQRLVKNGADDNNSDSSSYDNKLIACDSIQQPFCSSSKADYLVEQNYGAFELMPYDSMTSYWSDGTKYSLGAVSAMPLPTSGEYRMQDLFLVVPTGSDLKGLESKGYFDKDALTEAAKQKAVDTDRPFILWRDPSQYKTTTAPYGPDKANPFVPFDGRTGSTADTVKMKPAPSDENAYYLVESSEPDWQNLPDADVNAPESGTSKKADSSSAVDTSLFKQIANQYRFFSTGEGSQWVGLTVKDDGTFTGEVNEADVSSGGPIATAPRVSYPFHGKFSSIKANSANGYDMECDASSFGWDGNEYQYTDSIGIAPCGTWHWYPANTPFSSMASGTVVQEGLSINFTTEAAGTSSSNVLLYDESAKASAFIPYTQQ